jgi:hypothetical protein
VHVAKLKQKNLILENRKQQFCNKNYSTHGWEVSRGGCPDINHVSRNAQHRGERSEPAEGVTPPGVLVVQVLDRVPLEDVEEEHTLENTQILAPIISGFFL